MDTIVVMKDGAISEIGTYGELTEALGDFAQFLKTHSNGQTKDSVSDNQGNRKICFTVIAVIKSYILYVLPQCLI